MAVIVIISSCLLILFLVRAESQESSTSPCQPAAWDTRFSTQNTHIPPHDGILVRTIAFGSCYKPGHQIDDRLWKHLRQEFVVSNSNTTVWCWLGDNMYEDTNDMNRKREAYNAARNDIFYATSGPVAEPKIPTTGTWDDHDYAWNNFGNNYACPLQSQNEFVQHFGIPDSDPRHPAQGKDQQIGVYSSYMFHAPSFSYTNDNNAETISSVVSNESTDNGTTINGIHLIHLDARSHRSPTFAKYGICVGAASTMLGEEQWIWLEEELLNRTSEITIIGSGTQVLPPLHRTSRVLDEYCAYDGEGGVFDQAIAAVGEDDTAMFEGTKYESWAEIPQDRTRSLQLVQRSINSGRTKHVIFISGDQHWAEIMAKTIPATVREAAVTVFEVTASGIDQNWPHDIQNTHRLQPDQQYDGVLSVITATSDKNTCSGDPLHICSARANYGGISVDWDLGEITLGIYTPHEEDTVAALVTLALPVEGSFE